MYFCWNCKFPQIQRIVSDRHWVALEISCSHKNSVVGYWLSHWTLTQTRSSNVITFLFVAPIGRWVRVLREWWSPLFAQESSSLCATISRIQMSHFSRQKFNESFCQVLHPSFRQNANVRSFHTQTHFVRFHKCFLQFLYFCVRHFLFEFRRL